MKRLTYIIILILITFYVNAQFSDDFSDFDLRYNPEWKGNIEDFITNTKSQLQLDAYAAGTSIIYTSYPALDSFESGLYFNMDFKPSYVNKLRIYFMIDTVELSKASGYFINLGENGDEDKIEFYKLSQGTEILLASGTAGNFATQPANAYIKIIKSQQGLWQVFLKKDAYYYENEIEVFDNDYNFTKNYFLLKCKYTNARKDKFYFDDIYVKKLSRDSLPPKLCDAKIQNDYSVRLFFDEILNKENITIPDKYTLLNNHSHPIEVNYENEIPNSVLLKFENKFESGIIYTISTKNISDIHGNVQNKIQEKKFFISDMPHKGDLIINEILFNPLKGGKDFVELLNISNKFLELKGISISNAFKEKEYIINKEMILPPNKYICITSDTNNIINNYFVPDTAILLQNKLPSFDDDSGNITISSYNIIKHKKITLDSFDYDEEMHNSFLKNTDGISLERKNPYNKTNERFNWNSSSTQEGGATPGYKNTSFYKQNKNFKGAFKIVNKVFSPDFDGRSDELLIEYKFESNNNLTNIYIFDAKGRYIYKLVNNETLGRSGIINWNGFVEDKKLPAGLYLLYCEAIDENGKSYMEKKIFILAEKL